MPSVEQQEFTQERAGETQNGKLRALFLARPNEWIPMVEIGELIGAWAVHSRVADLRRKFRMNIRHRNEGVRPKRSFYLYEPEGQASASGSSTDGERAADLGAAAGNGKVERG